MFNKNNKKSLFNGIMIVSGTMIGAGMFSLPIVMAGMWFYYAIILLIITWFCMFMSGSMLLEANLNYRVGASFHTIIGDLLGKKWNLLNDISLCFVLYILTYAYISGTGAALHQTMKTYFNLSWSARDYGILFAIIGAAIVWCSTRAVGRLISIFLIAKIIAFFLTFGVLLSRVEPIQLFNPQALNIDYLKYFLYGFPFCLVSFGFQSNIPSLVKYYGKTPSTIVKCMLYGTLIALGLYIIWLIATQGNIPRENFKSLIAAGGNIDVLVQSFETKINSSYLNLLLIFFSNFAVISSFLGVTIGLFDYLADLFKYDDSKLGRLKTTFITFLPPLLAATFYPNGFIYAIGLAGLCCTIWSVIIPALLAKSSRKKWVSAPYRTWGGAVMIKVVLGFGLINIMVYLASAFNLLPYFK